ncbi:unnamed protein product [Prunus armeniaca]
MGQISREKLFWVIDSRSYFGPDLLGKWWGPPNQASSKADRAPKADDIRAAPVLLSNWAKGPSGKLNTAPAHHLQPGQAQGQILPGLQPEGADVSVGVMLTLASKKKL